MTNDAVQHQRYQHNKINININIRCHLTPSTRQALGVRHMNTVVGKKGKKGKIPAQSHPPSDEPNELNAPIGTAPQARPPGHTMQAVPLPPGAEPPAESEPEKGRVKVKFTAASGKVVREEPQMQVRVSDGLSIEEEVAFVSTVSNFT